MVCVPRVPLPCPEMATLIRGESEALHWLGACSFPRPWKSLQRLSLPCWEQSQEEDSSPFTGS